MTAKVIDGKRIAKDMRLQIKDAVAQRMARGLRPPGITVILVGDDPASAIYVNGKRRDCDEVGFVSAVQHLSPNVTQRDLETRIDALNVDPTVDGVLVQLPLPDHIDANRIIDHIDPSKDVDGFHPDNIGRLALRRPALRSATPKGVMHLLEHTGCTFYGLDATVIGASNHLGRPMALELLLAGCTVTVAHKFTRNTAEHTRRADIVISAVGIPGLVPGDWIKPGAVVIDVGITRDEHGKLHGDVRFDEACKVASWITPVPGGVGPMTRVALLQNTLQAAETHDSATATADR